MLKAHVDAMWARVAEENAKREKLERERVQQINTLVGNLVLKDMPTAVERGVKKEFSALGPTVTQAVLPPLQKAISMAVTENFQVKKEFQYMKETITQLSYQVLQGHQMY